MDDSLPAKDDKIKENKNAEECSQALISETTTESKNSENEARSSDTTDKMEKDRNIDDDIHDYNSADDDIPVKVKLGKIKRYSCEQCDQKFIKKVTLMYHVKQKHRLTKTCPICNKNIKSRSGKNGLRSHMLKNHTNKQKFTCKECDMVFNFKSQYNKHLETHENRSDDDEDDDDENEENESDNNQEEAQSEHSDNENNEKSEENDKSSTKVLRTRSRTGTQVSKKKKEESSDSEDDRDEDDDDSATEKSTPGNRSVKRKLPLSKSSKNTRGNNNKPTKRLRSDSKKDESEEGESEDSDDDEVNSKTRSKKSDKKSGLCKELRNLELDPPPKGSLSVKVNCRSDKKYSIRDEAKKKMMERLKKMRESDREQNKLIQDDKVSYRGLKFRKMQEKLKLQENKSSQETVSNRSGRLQDRNKRREEKNVKEEEEEEESENDGESSDSEVEEEAKNYFCTHCDLGFSHKFKLNHHVKEKHSRVAFDEDENDDEKEDEEDSEKDELTCGECGKECRNKNQMKLHQLKHLETKKIKAKRKLPIPTKSEKPTRKPPARMVPEVRLSREIRALVENDETDPVVRESVKSILRESMQKRTGRRGDVRVENDQETSKEIAKKKTTTTSAIKGKSQPSIIVRRGKFFYCTECNLTFKKEKFCTYHMKKIHETLYPFKACEHCGKIFRSCGPYKRHILKHKVHFCPAPNCKAKYRNFRRMRQHQKSAHPDRPYRCQRCIALFAKERELNKHLETEHDVTKSDDDEDEEDEEEEEEQQIEKKSDNRSPSKSTTKTPSKKPAEIPRQRKTRSSSSYREEEEEEDEDEDQESPIAELRRRAPDVTITLIRSAQQKQKQNQQQWRHSAENMVSL